MTRIILAWIGGFFGILLLLFVMVFALNGTNALVAPITGFFEKRVIVNRGAYGFKTMNSFIVCSRTLTALM